MRPEEAAAVLGIAAYEVLDVRPADTGWEILHHDMSSHVECWRPVPGTADKPDTGGEAPTPDVATTTTRRGRRKGS